MIWGQGPTAADLEQVEAFAEAELPRGVFLAPELLPDWFYGLLVLVVVAVSHWWWQKARRRRRLLLQSSGAVAAPPAAPSAREVMELRLQALRQLPLNDQVQRDEFYLIGNGVLRDYLHQNCLLPAPVRTSEEILQQWKGATEQLDLLASLLQPCDVVKFAKQKKSAEHAKQWLSRCQVFMEANL